MDRIFEEFNMVAVTAELIGLEIMYRRRVGENRKAMVSEGGDYYSFPILLF